MKSAKLRSARARPVRVLLVADHALARAGFRRLIESRPHYSVVAEQSHRELGGRRRAVEADMTVLLVASATPGESRALERAACRRHAKVLVLSCTEGCEAAEEALAAGAAAYLGSGATEEEFFAAMRAVLDGRAFVDTRLEGLQGLPTRGRAPRTASALSRREQQVLELLARGHTHREVGVRLGVGVKTVETYRARLAEKLGLLSRADVVSYALESGLLAPARPD
jgi:DNA-binding NarL/FixJ family response regulator